MTDLDVMDDDDGVLFDDFDAMAEAKHKKTGGNILEDNLKGHTFNKKSNKMLMEELGRVDTENSMRMQTVEDDDDCLNKQASSRDLVDEPTQGSGRGSRRDRNPLTKSVGLPKSRDQSDKSKGLLSIGGINLDFRKSKEGGLMSIFRSSQKDMSNLN